jgi:predicted PurR-regulated permease PerM
VVLIPALVAEGGQLISRLPELQGPLERLGVWAQAQAARLGYDVQPASIADWILPRIEGIGRNLLGAGAGVWKGVQGVIAFVSFLVITPVVATYMLRDIDRIREGLLEAIPPASRDGVDGFLQQVDRAISGYFRGQLLVGLVSGVIFAVGLTVLGMDYALLVGISAVVLNLVPYIGAAVTAVLAVSVGLLSDPSWTSLVKVGGLYLVASTVENVVSPRIMGHSLSLHPVVVMLSLLIAGQFLGLVGLLVAVPAAAVIKESLKVWAPQLMELLPLPRDAATSESEP